MQSTASFSSDLGEDRTVSVVIPVYNEELNIPHLMSRLTAVRQSPALAGFNFEFVLVDDHSSDSTPEIVKNWIELGTPIFYVRLARNCGSYNAVAAGLHHCSGDAAIIMSADLQDPPELIPELIAKWVDGYDVVMATREKREGEKLTTKLFARVYYFLMRRMAMQEIPSQGSDFLLMSRRVIDAYNVIGERNTSFLAMVIWLGFRRTSLGYVKQARHAGRSKWSFSRKIKLFVDSFVSFSYAPIRMMSLTGTLMAIAGIVYALSAVVCRLAGWTAGNFEFAALLSIFLIGQGVNTVMLGVLGEYLWRTYDESRGRPRFVVEKCEEATKQNVLSVAAADMPQQQSDAQLRKAA